MVFHFLFYKYLIFYYGQGPTCSIIELAVGPKPQL